MLNTISGHVTWSDGEGEREKSKCATHSITLAKLDK